MVENGTDAILGAEPIVLQFAHLASSALAFEALEQSCEKDAGRTEHRLYYGESETQILASCDDVGTFNAQSPDLEQGETDGVGTASAQRPGGIGLPSFRTSHTGRDESHGSQFD